MKALFLLSLICFCTVSTCCQPKEDEDQSIRRVIEQLFLGMERGDSALVHSTLSQDVNFVSVYRNKANEPVIVREESAKEFLIAVGTPASTHSFWGRRSVIVASMLSICTRVRMVGRFSTLVIHAARKAATYRRISVGNIRSPLTR